MAIITLEERHAKLEQLLEELKLENERVPILVEGRRDVASLRNLGLAGEIFHVNIGKPLLTFCETYAQKYQAVILLMDWDPRGRRLDTTLKTKCNIVHVEVNDKYWLELRKLAFPEIKDVQSLYMFFEYLREQKRLATTQP